MCQAAYIVAAGQGSLREYGVFGGLERDEAERISKDQLMKVLVHCAKKF